jgi:predicted metal-dependent peptidase
MSRKWSGRQAAAAVQARQEGWQIVKAHAVFGALAEEAGLIVDTDERVVTGGAWAAISPAGNLWVHAARQAGADEWARVFGILLACLGFGLVRRQEPHVLWEIASFLVAERFCDELRLGRLPASLQYPAHLLPAGGAEGLLRQFCVDGCAAPLRDWYAGAARDGGIFCNFDDTQPSWRKRVDWRALFADGIARGVGRALEVASGASGLSATGHASRAQRARRRLIDHYPLLGALAASFDIDDDLRSCQRNDVQVAAIDVGIRRIWMNPATQLNDDECLFVFAHELLHAGLNHASRRQGRDALLWNIACDFAINGWLVEMRIGVPPSMGLLHDLGLAGQSAEEIYDRLATDMRRARKLATLRGLGAPDLIGIDEGSVFVDAEAYCRRALAQGYERYTAIGSRGTLPAGLAEEIRSLSQPPIPWDVRLAHWFDERFPPPERRRSYARPSRRQSATPDIPRPSAARPDEESRASRVFGVVLDTSGSMDAAMLGKALGAIASYALAREVSAVRLVCCDAEAYDSGWVEPEGLLERYRVVGRGGTVLQPGLDCLRELAARGDFPRAGPLLVITDGACEDKLATAMDHAYLLPQGRRLPFRAQGEVFYVS